MKHQLWKWLGSLFMEPKKDAKGEAYMAVSLSKFQKLICLIMAVALFVTMLVLWIVEPEILNGGVTDPIPESMMNAFWGLLGLTGANQLASAVARRTGASD